MKQERINNNIVHYKSFFWSPDYLDTSSAWIEHIPFAFWIVEVLQPKTVVELGVHGGVSYFSFCQAVKMLNINSVCFGVDTWKGDEHAGFYSEEIFDKVNNYNIKEYSRFSTLIRSTFDEAKEYFIDKSIDLLHIDGLHTYEAVKHDFETWLPKLSDNAVVIFHDINVRQSEFGVFRFWHELKQTYPHFEFNFEHGLGILGIGGFAQNELVELSGNNESNYTFFRNFFSERGNFFKTKLYKDAEIAHKKLQIAELTNANAQLNSNSNSLQSEIGRLNSELDQLKSHYGHLVDKTNELEQTRDQLRKNFEATEEKRKQLSIQFQNDKAELSNRLTETQVVVSSLAEKLSAIEKENEILKKNIAWYQSTFEYRNIFGIIKDRIKSSLKKKEMIPPASSNDKRSDADLTDFEHDQIKFKDTGDNNILSESGPPNELNEILYPDSLAIRYKEEVSDLSDVCLFSSFSFSGNVEEYVFYYLSELKKAGFSIVFISTSALENSCLERLSQFAFLIIERENRCPDFGSWKAGLSMLNLQNLNSILLTNDSIFGPFFDLNNIIFSMKDKYDVWGMSDNYEISYHLQSYFLLFNKQSIQSGIFNRFWRDVNLAATKDEVIHKYEIGLSKVFKNAGYKLGAYARIDDISQGADHKVINPLLVFWKSLITKHQFPFFKRELLIKRKISINYFDQLGLCVNVTGWRKLISETTSYPVEYIDAFISNYYKDIKRQRPDTFLTNRKILFLTDNGGNGESQRLLLYFLQWLKKETSVHSEIIICNNTSNEQAAAFSDFGIVTVFTSLSAEEKIILRNRLIDDVAVVISGSVKNLDVQKFLSFIEIPQIILVHEPALLLENVFPLHENISWINRNVSRLIFASESAKEEVEKYTGWDATKLSVVSKFVNPCLYDNSDEDREIIKSQLEIPPEAFVVAIAGDFEEKNSDLLLAVCTDLCKGYENIHVILLDEEGANPHHTSVHADVAQARLSRQVHFAGKSKNMRPVFPVVNLLVVWAGNDSVPIIILENGIAGNPVIHFQKVKPVIDYEKLGIGESVSYPDINALTKKVLEYYNNRPLPEAKKDSIAREIKENFSVDKHGPTLLREINSFYDQAELMLVDEPLLTFMTHIYYEDSWDEIRNKLKNFDNGKNYFLFSISEACSIKDRIVEDIKQSFSNTYYLITSNIGKDIGGKLALIDLYILLGIRCTYIVFLHDKQSPHSIRGDSWKKDLFKIIDFNNQSQILNLFNDPRTGIVDAKDYIINEYNADTDSFKNNNYLSKKLLTQFNLSVENYDFLGGFIYWIRASIIEDFFTENHPILIRENLEAGNVMDLHGERLTHTWERMFSWIANSEGYKVNGI